MNPKKACKGNDCNNDSSAVEHKPKEKNRLLWSIILTFTVMLIEVAGGVVSRSLALLSDAGHMLTHFLALLISLVAIILAAKPKDNEKTFGYYRLEIIAALVNGIFVILVSIYIFYESIRRFISPVEVKTSEMLIIAIIGLIANLLVMLFLHDVSKHDLNIKSAFLHVIGDALSSVGVIIGGVVIYYTKINQIDSIISFMIAAVILYWGLNLIKDSVDILLERTPPGISIKELKAEVLKEFSNVSDMHDIHVWELTTERYCLSAHVSMKECKLSEGTDNISRINDFLNKRYGISHVTLQLECD